MRAFSFLLLTATCLTFAVNLFSQDHENWWNVEDYGIDYMLPEEWRSDPFSSSSVCDCPGTINDNGWFDSTYIGMVIYPVNEAELDSSDRQQIWGYGFVEGEQVESVSFAGIPYKATYGSFSGMKGWPKVWQLVSTDKVKDNYKHLIIYFWSEESVFNANKHVFDSIMESFERKKVKY